jgi:D-3-phosphoglycerate dehydrogenase
MKALFLDDGFFTEEAVKQPACKRRLNTVPDLEIDFAKDRNGFKYESLPAYFERIEKEGPEGWIAPDEEVKQKLPWADVLFVHGSGVTKEMMQMAPNLRLIFLLRSGTENVNLEAAKARNITVCNCPSRLGEPVADFTVGLMIAECRGLTHNNLQATDGEWDAPDKKDPACAALCNLTIGLYGYGGIGRAVAKRMVKGFGSYVIAYDPYCDESTMKEDGVVPVTEEQLLKVSDIVSMHARYTQETKNIFGEAKFKLMKPTAVFINTARAGLVDEQALVDALKNKTIRSAGLDVFWEEPIPKDHVLLTLPNVTLTPHMAGVTSDVVSNTINIMASELRRFALGEPLKFTVV